jgi:hypothetical protein
VIDLVKKIKKQDNRMQLPKADDLEDLGIFPMDDDVQPLKEVRQEREDDIKTA